MLTTTSYGSAERAPSGASEGGGGGSGVPVRYDYTGRARCTISPWNDATFAYSLLQLNLGYNPMSKLEVVSALNTVNISTQMYAYSPTNRTERYYPKVYIGTPVTTAKRWNYDDSISPKIPDDNSSKIGWPENFEGPQKGEAI